MKTTLTSNGAVVNQWIANNVATPKKGATEKQIEAFLDKHNSYIGMQDIVAIGRVKSMQYVNDTVYSYGAHFAIARFVGNDVLYTNRGYSSSTGVQKAIVRRALAAANITYIEVDNVMAKTVAEHRANVLNLQARIIYTHKKMNRAWKNKTNHALALRETIKAHNAYVDRYLVDEVHWGDTNVEGDILIALLKGSV